MGKIKKALAVKEGLWFIPGFALRIAGSERAMICFGIGVTPLGDEVVKP